ncbi:tyrosine-protein phosphatase non-receptor type 23-like [Paramacrobiotus metropolitanus]|uniref:tyrosine-protein phosphatase non-receptor type 23-like n=1 Tax=Paramacrobiotus metropolitanus TaxID=2943436 RepID=UPI002445FDF6|nr:tyrosine-protein phosphatase non-receptor type 23-like [Paramacrobiotus metropolitanus]
MLEQSRAEVATLRQDLEQRLQTLGDSEAGSAELQNVLGRVDKYYKENNHLKQGIISLEGEIDELQWELDFLRTAYEKLRLNQNDPEGVAIDLRLCQAQLGQQIRALTTHLQNETARFKQARIENLGVIEAQRARITQLESEKTQWETYKDRLPKYQQELYDFGTDVSNKYNDLCEKHNQLIQERENLGIEVACLKEEKTYLEDSMTEQPPSYRSAQEQDKCQQIDDYLRRDNPLLNPTGQTGAHEGQTYQVGMLRAEPSVGPIPRPPVVPSAPEPERNISTATPNAPTHSTTTTTTAYGGTSTTTMFSTGTRPVASTSTGQDQPRGSNLRAPVAGPGMGLRPPTNASAGSSQPNSGNSNRDRQRSGSQNTYPPRIEVQPVSAGQRNWADPVRPGYPDNVPQQPRLDNRGPIGLVGPGAVGNVPYQPQQGNMDPIGPAPQADQYVVIPPGMWLDQNRVLQRIPGYVAPNQPPNQGNGAQNPPPGPGQPQQPAPPGNPYPQPQPYPPQPVPAAQNQQAAYPIGWNPPVAQQAAPVAQPRQTPPPDEQDIAQARLEGYEEGRRRYEERNNRILAQKNRAELPKFNGNGAKVEGWITKIRRIYRSEADDVAKTNVAFMTELEGALTGQVTAVADITTRKYMLGQETPEQYYDAIINLKQRGNLTDELAVFYLRTNVTEPILRAALDVRMPKTTREFRDYVRDFTRGKPMYQVVKGGNTTNYITVKRRRLSL